MSKTDYININNLLHTLSEKTNPLSKEEEHELIKKYQENNDNQALKKLILANIRFVLNYISKYKNKKVSLEDLLHEGILGLIEAAKRFDVKRNLKFISYAAWWVKQSVVNAISNQMGFFKLPAKTRRLLVKIYDLQKESLEKNRRFLSDKEIIEKLEISQKTLNKLNNLMNGQISLSHPLNKNGSIVIGDTVSQKDNSSIISDSIIRKLVINEIKEIIDGLEEKEKKIIVLRYGLDGGKSKSLAEIGKVLNLSRERVRQIEKRALRKIRSNFDNKVFKGE